MSTYSLCFSFPVFDLSANILPVFLSLLLFCVCVCVFFSLEPNRFSDLRQQTFDVAARYLWTKTVDWKTIFDLIISSITFSLHSTCNKSTVESEIECVKVFLVIVVSLVFFPRTIFNPFVRPSVCLIGSSPFWPRGCAAHLHLKQTNKSEQVKSNWKLIDFIKIKA